MNTYDTYIAADRRSAGRPVSAHRMTSARVRSRLDAAVVVAPGDMIQRPPDARVVPGIRLVLVRREDVVFGQFHLEAEAVQPGAAVPKFRTSHHHELKLPVDQQYRRPDERHRGRSRRMPFQGTQPVLLYPLK
jgi:hypothetical protein